MKLWNAAVVAVLVVQISNQLRLGSDDSIELFDFISNIIDGLLSDKLYQTVHFLHSINDYNVSFSDLLISNIAHKYEGPVANNLKSYNEEDAVIIITSHESFNNTLLNEFDKIRFLILIVSFAGSIEKWSSVISSLRTTKIIKAAVISFDRLNMIDETFINLSIFSQHKTKNCQNEHTLITSPMRMSDLELTMETIVKNTIFGPSFVDFQNCPIEVGITLLAPFTISDQNMSPSGYSGLEVELMAALAEYFNFEIRYVRPFDGLQWGILHENGSTGLMAMLQNEQVDLAIGSIARSLARNTLLRAGVGSFYDQVIFALPPGIPYTPLQKLYMPVSTSGWIFLIVVGIITSILFSLDENALLCRISYNRRTLSFIDMWFILLGGAMHNSPKTILTKYALIAWLTITLVSRSAYQAILFDHLRCGDEFKPLLTLADIDEAGLKYYMYNVTQRFFLRSPQILKR